MIKKNFFYYIYLAIDFRINNLVNAKPYFEVFIHYFLLLPQLMFFILFYIFRLPIKYTFHM